ncbi:MAG: hypothetical protein KKB50_21635 [Planctomycetes bacterium]|nr:hypothetical protein [Planctomycetota bacterium]
MSGLRDGWQRAWHALNHPLFGTKVIPKGAEVDPARFPEDEFPVYCPKCSYTLHGLPDDRCPECGEPFQRGALLVRQYIHDIWPRPNRWGTAERVCWIAMWTSLGIMAIVLGASYMVSKDRWPAAVCPRLVSFVLGDLGSWAMWVLRNVGWVAGGVLLVLTIVRTVRSAEKRRAIIAAIRQAESDQTKHPST